GQCVAGWLYRVAYRIALSARSDAAKLNCAATPNLPSGGPDPAMEACKRELCAVLTEEVSRLPSRLRAPVVLCYVEGLTRDKSAQQLGCSLRTLQRQLEKALGLLRRRLTQRGITFSAALLGSVLSEPSAALAVPAPLVAAALRATTTLGNGM